MDTQEHQQHHARAPPVRGIAKEGCRRLEAGVGKHGGDMLVEDRGPDFTFGGCVSERHPEEIEFGIRARHALRNEFKLRAGAFADFFQKFDAVADRPYRIYEIMADPGGNQRGEVFLGRRHARHPEREVHIVLNAFLEPGQLVRHPDRPDWGLGQIQSVIGDRITVNFENEGKVVINGSLIELRPDTPDR